MNHWHATWNAMLNCKKCIQIILFFKDINKEDYCIFVKRVYVSDKQIDQMFLTSSDKVKVRLASGGVSDSVAKLGLTLIAD